jgi:hypothetical protein
MKAFSDCLAVQLFDISEKALVMMYTPLLQRFIPQGKRKENVERYIAFMTRCAITTLGPLPYARVK